jgi:P pilus assembly chaperone PapD
VENVRDRELAIEVSAFRRTTDEQGKEIRTDSDLFQMFPQQFNLPANGRRAVRVTWLGPEAVTDEEAYRIKFEQLPIEEKVLLGNQRSANIQFRLNYVTSVYIPPKNGEAKIVVSNYKKTAPDTLEITVANQGNIHFIPDQHTFLVKAPNQPDWTIPSDALKAFYDDNLLAKSTRTYTLKVPNTLPDKDLSFFLKSSP